MQFKFALARSPLADVFLRRRKIVGAISDIVDGAIETGLLVIPALWGAIAFDVDGAMAGGVIGNALTDAIA